MKDYSMFKSLQRILKGLKNPNLIIPFIKTYLYQYLYKDISKIIKNCEGLISLREAVYLYKTVLGNKEKEGDILDFGSYKGLSTCILSYAAAKSEKNVIAFEWFKGLPPPNIEIDGDFFKQGEYLASKVEFESNIKKWGYSENVKLIEGDAVKTLNEEIKLRRINKYSFAFIDVDLYTTIKDILFLLDNISEGNEIICVHDIHSPGVQMAIKEFMNSCENKVSIYIQPATGIAKLTIKGNKNENRKSN